MTQQEYEEKLIHIEEMIKQDHAMITSMHRTQRLTNLIRIMYWVILIGGFLGAYYWVYPYLDTAKDWYKNASSQMKKTQDSFSRVEQKINDFNKTKNKLEDSGKNMLDSMKSFKAQ